MARKLADVGARAVGYKLGEGAEDQTKEEGEQESDEEEDEEDEKDQDDQNKEQQDTSYSSDSDAEEIDEESIYSTNWYKKYESEHQSLINPDEQEPSDKR